MYLLLADHWFAQKESNVKSPMSKAQKVFTFQMLKRAEWVLTTTTIQISCVYFDNLSVSEIILISKE